MFIQLVFGDFTSPNRKQHSNDHYRAICMRYDAIHLKT